jgi:hypothetical protein
MHPSERSRYFVVQSGDDFELATACFTSVVSKQVVERRIAVADRVPCVGVRDGDRTELDELLDACERQ